MKKILLFLSLCVCLLFSMSGCGDNEKDAGVKTSKTYTFSVDTGDRIQIKINTTDGYDMTSELPFEISQDGEILSQGIFISEEQYGQYEQVVEDDEMATLIDSGEKEGNNYIFWSYDDSEYNIAILVKDSGTGILLGNTISEETAWACFDQLEIKIDD